MICQPGSSPGPSVRYACPAGTGGCSKLPLASRFGPAAAGGPGSGSTCSTAVAVPKLQPAVITTGVGAVTGRVVTTKVALLAPAGTVTVAGTPAAAGLLLARVTSSPPGPAGCASVT